MQLSEKTLEILKNFSKINVNLFIEKGSSHLRTVSESKNIFASVEVEETFPVDAGIMNLHKLLQTMSMFEQPDLSFEDTHILITEAEGRNTFTYYYTEPNCLTYPKAQVKDFPTPVTFTLNEDTLGQIIKASSISQLPDVKITYDNNVVALELQDRQNPTSNVFSFKLDGQGTESITAFMKVENLKLVAGDYKMMVSNTASRLENLSPEMATLQYCIAMDLTHVR